MSCNFKLPTIAIPIPSLTLPDLPRIPFFRLDLDFAITLPRPSIQIPSLTLPDLPRIPIFTLDLDIPLPKLPTIRIPIPSLNLPEIPRIPFFEIPCPFEDAPANDNAVAAAA